MSLHNHTNFTRTEEFEVDALHLAGVGAPIRTGIVAGTKVETDSGWRPVENLLSGTKVQTYAGLRRVARIERSFVEPANRLVNPEPMLLVPGGVLNNCSAFYLLPDQLVLLETIYGQEIFGDAATLVPGAALAGFRGIEQVRPRGLVEIITLQFDEEDVVYGNTGVLFHCPSVGANMGAGLRSDYFLTLTTGQAVELLALLEGASPSAGFTV